MQASTASSSDQKNMAKEAEKGIYITMAWCMGFGFLGLLGYPLAVAKQGHLIWVGLLLALAAFGIGFFTGTLFGMPKRNDQADSDYTLNNSLVEISDWLTKIIVGLGLVNLTKIPDQLESLADYVSQSATVSIPFLKVYIISVVLYFSILGLYLGYNYMRLVLSLKYKHSDTELLRKELIAKQQQINALASEVEESKSTREALIQVVNQSEEEPAYELSNARLDDLKSKAIAKTRSGQSIHPDDPQKGQWGGLAAHHDRELVGHVEEIRKGLYNVILEVRSTSPSSSPLTEGSTVLFAIHPSFGEPPIRIRPVEHGVAQLKLISYGSFTAGVFADNGETELELDLATLPGVSEYFKSH